MADTYRTSDIDPETLEVLLATGIDPAAFLKRRAELAAMPGRTPVEEAKLSAEQEALRPCLEAAREFNRVHGPWHDPYAEAS